MIHAEFIEDTQGDLVDVQYFCSGQCYTLTTGNDYYGHGWPCGSETDYDVSCSHCGTLLWRGLTTENEEKERERIAAVIRRVKNGTYLN